MAYFMNIWVTKKCNMKCAYCYEDTGLMREANVKNNKEMSYETADKIIAFIKKNINKENAPLMLNFHGGEPFLNYKIIKYFLDAVDDAGIDYTSWATTNGTLLDIDDVKSVVHRLDFISVSLDGTKKSHTLNRKFAEGDAEYEKVLQNCINLNETHRNLPRVRMTVDINTVENLFDNISYLANLKFKQIAVSPNYYNKEWNTATADIWLREIQKIREFYKILGKDYKINLLEKKVLRKSKCTSGHDYLNIDTDGTFYACTAVMGSSNHIIGSIECGIDKEKVAEITNMNNCEISQCKNCKLYECCTTARCRLINKAITGDYLTPIALSCFLQRNKCDT